MYRSFSGGRKPPGGLVINCYDQLGVLKSAEQHGCSAVFHCDVLQTVIGIRVIAVAIQRLCEQCTNGICAAYADLRFVCSDSVIFGKNRRRECTNQ